MFAGNAFGWAYFADAYAGAKSGGSNVTGVSADDGSAVPVFLA